MFVKTEIPKNINRYSPSPKRKLNETHVAITDGIQFVKGMGIIIKIACGMRKAPIIGRTINAHFNLDFVYSFNPNKKLYILSNLSLCIKDISMVCLVMNVGKTAFLKPKINCNDNIRIIVPPINVEKPIAHAGDGMEVGKDNKKMRVKMPSSSKKSNNS